MTNAKKPVHFILETNLFAPNAEEVFRERPERADERKRRLAKSRSQDLARFKRYAGLDGLITAISYAAKRHKDGKEFPIHFDIVRKTADYSETQRFTMSDAAILRECGKEAEARMTHLNSIFVYWCGSMRRHHSIPAHFRVIVTAGVRENEIEELQASVSDFASQNRLDKESNL